jgi:hypothetical protein
VAIVQAERKLICKGNKGNKNTIWEISVMVLLAGIIYRCTAEMVSGDVVYVPGLVNSSNIKDSNSTISYSKALVWRGIMLQAVGIRLDGVTECQDDQFRHFCNNVGYYRNFMLVLLIESAL